VTDPSSGPDDPQYDKAENAALKRIGPPARLMLFLSLLNLVMGVYVMVRMILLKKEGPNAELREQADKIAKDPVTPEFFKRWTAEDFLTFSANSILGCCGISGLVSVFTLAGARRMLELRSYGLAVTAAVLMAIPCLTPGCFLGQLAGVWAFVILMQPDVRKAFQ
jgi:hypothetical protein